MFERKKYKQFAKKQLAKRWGIPILITVIVFIIDGLLNADRIAYPQLANNFYDLLNNNISYDDFINYLALGSPLRTDMLFWMEILFSLISGIFSVACINVYLKMSHSPEKVKFSSFLQGFNFWFKAAFATFWDFLWTFLWSLLFIIPGIVKSIAYSQMYYLIVEYPKLSVTKAMRISILITKGHKADLFVMYLSFIGWAILAAIPFGLGFIFLSPYQNMTFVNAYHALLKEAVESGKLKPEDLTE